MSLAGYLWPALVAVETVAVAVALWRVPRSPIVWLLLFALVDEVAVEMLHRFAFEGAPRPFGGAIRALYHLETALVLGWPAGLAAASWQVSLAPPKRARRSRKLPHRADWEGIYRVAWEGDNKEPRPFPVPLALAGMYLGATIGLAAAYPLPRERLAMLFQAWETMCVAFAWAGIRRGWGRAWGRVEVSLVALASCETMVAAIGPFASNPFTKWWIASTFYVVTWVAVATVIGSSRGFRR